MSGLSRTPGKRVGVNSPPRVRIPLPPPARPMNRPREGPFSLAVRNLFGRSRARAFPYTPSIYRGQVRGKSLPRTPGDRLPLHVRRADRPGRWSVGGINGLALQVTATGARRRGSRLCVADRHREQGWGNA
jgi:hypothetical protein